MKKKIEWDVVNHRFAIPFLYTFLWGIGIMAIGDVYLGDLKNYLPYANLYSSALTIYIIFIFEYFLAFIDITIVLEGLQFRKRVLIWWGIMVIYTLVTIVALKLTFVYLRDFGAMFWIIFSLMLVQKFFSCIFQNNVDWFTSKIHYKEIVSKFQSPDIH